MWAAHFLKQAEPDLDVRIVEAEYAGAGASGHNDGFVTPTIGHSLHTVVGRAGLEGAKDAYVAVGRSILELRRFCRRHGVEADLDPRGFFLVATSDGQLRRLEHDAELAGRMGVSYEVLDGGPARERIGSAAIEAALKTPGAMVNPHKLALGLRRVVRQQGVTVYEGTPALAVGGVGGAREVRTPAGRIVADRLVLATNAAQHQWAPFRNRVKPVWSYAAVTEPLSDEQRARVAWPEREGFVEARNFITFCRWTAENRLLVGGGPALYRYGRDMDERHLRNDEVTRILREALVGYFPAWRDVRLEYAYGGCIAVTRDLIPHVGTVAPGVHHAHGYCGNGIAMTHLAGKVLRDLVLGVESPYSGLFFVRAREPRFPREPIAFLGARGLSALLAWQDRHPGALRRQII
jgi:glycine/D-amino acid oxidase-like deaminating enzyme